MLNSSATQALARSERSSAAAVDTSARPQVDHANRADRPDRADRKDRTDSSRRLPADDAVHRALVDRPELRDAVYTRLARSEPALIHHLETWREQDAQAQRPPVTQAHIPAGPALAMPALLQDRLGPVPSLRPAFGTVEVETTPARPGAVEARPEDAPAALQASSVAALWCAAVPAGRSLLAQAVSQGSQIVQGMARSLMSAADALAVAQAVKEVMAENLPERRAVALSEQANEIETRHGREAAIEFVARVVEQDPAGFAEGMTSATYGAIWQNDAATQRLIAQGIARAYERAPGGAAGQQAFAAQLVEGMQAGQGGIALSEVAHLVGLTGNDALQVQFVEAGLDKAHEMAMSQDLHTLMGADKLVASLAPAVRDSTAAVQAVIDKTQELSLGSYAGDMHAAGTDSLNWVLNQFAQSSVHLGQGEYVNGLSIFLDAAVPADAPPYPGAPFTVAQKPLSSEQSFALFTALAGDTDLLHNGDPNHRTSGVAATSRLFEHYMPAWIDDGLIAGTATGTINDAFDPALQNFLEHALFNPETDGPYRQRLMGQVIGLLGGLSDGTVGAAMDSEARGRLAGGLIALIDQGFDAHADEIRADGATKQAWADFAIGLAFAFVPGAPGGKVASILVGQGVGQSQAVVEGTISQLIQAGVDADIAKAAAEAANRGELLEAFEAIELPPEAMAHVREYIELQSNSLGSGNKTVGELLLDILSDNGIWSDAEFVDGVGDGWNQVQGREG